MCSQQEAIGILGVNLIYAAFYELQSEESFQAGLADDVVKDRIEIDYVDLRGPAFEGWDRRTLLAHLVSAGFAEAVFFPSKGATVPPTEALYKKALVLAPGHFGHGDQSHSQVHMRLLASAIQELQKELGDTKVSPAGFFCLTAAPHNAKRTGAGSPRLASSNQRSSRCWRRCAAFSPRRALQYENSRKPLHAGACALRRWPFPDDSSD